MAARAQQGHAVFQVGNYAIPEAAPQWNYQINSIDRHRWNHMTNYLKEGMMKLTVKSVNCEKVKEIQQEPDENLAVFERRLMETFRKYTYVDPSSPKGQALLAIYFIAQSAPDTRHKIQKETSSPRPL